jgi:hypothetical protein
MHHRFDFEALGEKGKRFKNRFISFPRDAFLFTKPSILQAAIIRG